MSITWFQKHRNIQTNRIKKALISYTISYTTSQSFCPIKTSTVNTYYSVCWYLKKKTPLMQVVKKANAGRSYDIISHSYEKWHLWSPNAHQKLLRNCNLCRTQSLTNSLILLLLCDARYEYYHNTFVIELCSHSLSSSGGYRSAYITVSGFSDLIAWFVPI